MPARSNELSFDRMFCYRAAGLAGYIALFYVLVGVGLRGWVALVVLIGATIVTTFIYSWREGEGWLPASGNALVIVAFCGVMTSVLIKDQRPVNVPGLALVPFSLCASEGMFFLAALGAFGEKVAEPSLAMAIGVAMLLVQVSVLAAGFQYFAKPVVKNRRED